MAKDSATWKRTPPLSHFEVDHCARREKVYLRLETKSSPQSLRRLREGVSPETLFSLECALHPEQAGILAEVLVRQAQKAAGIIDH